MFVLVFCDQDEDDSGSGVQISLRRKKRREERACGSWYSWAAAKRWEMCFVWADAAATIYWEEINRTISFCLPIHTGEKSSHTHTHAPEEEDDENGSLTKYFPRQNGIRIASPYLELSFWLDSTQAADSRAPRVSLKPNKHELVYCDPEIGPQVYFGPMKIGCGFKEISLDPFHTKVQLFPYSWNNSENFEFHFAEKQKENIWTRLPCLPTGSWYSCFANKKMRNVFSLSGCARCLKYISTPI